MLPIICALTLTSASIEFNIPVRHVRPSRIAAMILGTEGRPPLLRDSATVKFDDDKWILTVIGDAEEVSEARQFVKLVDIAHPTIKLSIQVDAPADRVDYDVVASLRSGQKWSLKEDATGTGITLSPRLNDDGTCTIMLDVEHEAGKLGTVLRVKPGQVQVIPLGSKITREIVVNAAPTKVTHMGRRFPPCGSRSR